MTAFDNQLLDLIAGMAADGEVQVSAQDLAVALDCSTATIRRAMQRTCDDGRLEVIHSPGRGSVLRLTGVGEQGEQTTHRYPPPLRGGVGTDEQTTHTSRTPPGPPKPTEKATTPQPRPADRDCPRCEGTGMVFIDIDANVVTDCECRGPETRAYRRARQVALERSWGSPRPTGDGPPAKSDLTEVWRGFIRRQLAGQPDDPPPDNVIPITQETLT